MAWVYLDLQLRCQYASPGAQAPTGPPAAGHVYTALPPGEVTEVLTGGVVTGYLVKLRVVAVNVKAALYPYPNPMV